MVIKLTPPSTNSAHSTHWRISSFLRPSIMPWILTLLITIWWMSVSTKQLQGISFMNMNSVTYFSQLAAGPNNSTDPNHVREKTGKTIVREPRPLWPGKSAYASDYYILSNTSTSDCLNIEIHGGWGNFVFVIFYALLTHESKDYSRPCIEPGVRGDTITSLFQNIPACDPHWLLQETTETYCMPVEGMVPPKSWGNEIIPSVMNPSAAPFLRRYLALNRSYVVHELLQGSSEPMDLIKRSCAVQVRFGDSYFRPPEVLKKRSYPDFRIRGCDVNNMNSCYEKVARWVDNVCPQKEEQQTPIFVATDISNFTRFLIDSRPNRHIWNSKQLLKENHKNNKNNTMMELHTHDIPDNHVPTTMLLDWISLALANQSHAFARSTFAETAKLGLYLVGDEAP